jgi:starch-binding outer membrane protein, SusD/RagB family
MKMYMNKLAKGVLLTVALGLFSCTSYLDRSPEAEVSSTAAFVNFTNFQGFVEEMYSCIPDYTGITWATDWNLADEVIHGSDGIWLNDLFDKGTYWGWTTSSWISWLDNGPSNSTTSTMSKGLWPDAWYVIRKANLGLANIDNLTDATDEEKNFIKGQLLFFRGFFHFELMTYWGGLPYVNKVLESNEKIDMPRLSSQSMADSIASDLREAANLLPADWDNTTTGKLTEGNNRFRATKVMALGYLGKDYLYAGSPLWNYTSHDNSDSYRCYDASYCKKAASAFAELLQLVDGGSTFVKLIDWSSYSTLFHNSKSAALPGYPEDIMEPEAYNIWFNGCAWGPSCIFNTYGNASGADGAGYVSVPANFVDNFGMANGLPIDDPNSGYDASDPWKNRDPRFYNDIIKDSDRIVKSKAVYARFYTGGRDRSSIQNSSTGYVVGKLTPITCNSLDGYPDNAMLLSYMRLADVYLMYAEAVYEGYSLNPQATADGYSLTAVGAVNKIRERAGAGDVGSSYAVQGSSSSVSPDDDKFMSEVIRERAVELCFEEEHRFNDLRRWMIYDKLKYRQKYSLEFDRDQNTGKPINMTRKLLVTRPWDSKYWWLPLKTKDVYLYSTFTQNPGY